MIILCNTIKKQKGQINMIFSPKAAFYDCFRQSFAEQA
jgi:hypothetical protein